tara:strand:+ start:895 stop:1452 length:558 start_codon:yes stop_codon:yes gene_type:complete
MKYVISFILLFSFGANATLLSINTDQSSYKVGDTIVAQVSLSELDSALRLFQFDFNFTSNIMSFMDMSFGSSFGQGIDSDQTALDSANSVYVEEYSYLADNELSALQPSQFILATLRFKAQAIGDTIFSVSADWFGDVSNQGVLVTYQIDNFSITNDPSHPVPEPASLLILLSGILVIFKIRATK